MDIGDYLRVVRRFWWLVLVATVVGAGIGYATSFMYTPKYESTARLFVTTQSGTSVGDAYQNNLFSQQRVVSYAGLATSQQVAVRAINQLKAPISPDELRKKITATPLENTVLLDITARDTDPATAQTYANAVADQLVQLVSELETSRRGGTPAAGAIVVDDANYPTRAGGPNLLTRIGMGAAAGLVMGLLLAVLAAVLDTRLRSRERVDALTGSLVLGALVADPCRLDDGVIDLDSGGILVERLRELRTNLQFAKTADGRRPRVIAVTSPSSRDGRSTTAIDLAAAFAESGRSVVLVDGDLLNPSLAQRLHLTDDEHAHAANRGLSTVLSGDHDVAGVLIENVGNSSWAFLPAGPMAAARGQLWAEDTASSVLDTLRRDFDYVIIDTPPLNTCTDGALAAALGDGAIVLARVGHTKTAALRRALEALQVAHASFIGAVITCEPGHRSELSKDRKQVTHASQTASARVPTNQPEDALSRSDVQKRSYVQKIVPSSAPRTKSNESAAGSQLEPHDGAHRLNKTTPGGR